MKPRGRAASTGHSGAEPAPPPGTRRLGRQASAQPRPRVSLPAALPSPSRSGSDDPSEGPGRRGTRRRSRPVVGGAPPLAEHQM